MATRRVIAFEAGVDFSFTLIYPEDIPMAKIPVEKKQQPSWIWWLLGLLVLGGITWALVETFDDEEEADVAAMEEVEPIPPPPPTDSEDVDIGAILASPGQYVGEPFPSTEITVASVPTDRGFWISENGDSLFALIIDVPEEQPMDINPNQTLQIEGGTLRDSSFLPELSGRPLDAATEKIAREQSIFVVLDERNITIEEEGATQQGADPAQSVQ